MIKALYAQNYRKFLSAVASSVTVFVMACSNSSGASSSSNNPFTKPDGTLGANEFALIVDGRQNHVEAGLFEEVLKEEEVQVPYEGTCTRTVQDGTREECRTEYRDEQKCGYERVCHDERECRVVPRCHNEQVCHSERECRVVPRCDREQICDNREECRNVPRCTDERKCEVINGQRECRVEKVCQTERVCENRPECRYEERCTNERECHDVPRCQTERVCRDERECQDVPRCNNEYICHTERVPYPVCHDVPNYREEKYSCTKYRKEIQQVLDYKHQVILDVTLDVPVQAPGIEDVIKFSSVNGELVIESLVNESGLAYLVSVTKSSENIADQEKVTRAIVTIKAVPASQIRAALDVQKITANKTGVVMQTNNVQLPAGLKTQVKLVVKKVRTAKIETLFDRVLKSGEVTRSAAGELTINFSKVGLTKALSEKRKYLVTVELSAASTEGLSLLDPSQTTVVKDTEFSTK